jgi:pimeloyl-ACP methyl ester carboxylesterase
MRALGLVATSLFWTLACESGQAPAPAPSPVPKVESRAPLLPTQAREERIATDDGQALAATLYAAASGAPALLLVHSQDADRKEWDPIVERLVKAPKRYTVLAFDRRGHGASPAMTEREPAAVLDRHQSDVAAALAHVQRVAAPSATVLVGSSFGAALAATLAERSSNVSALGLISPGQAVMGLDLYKPFARIRNIPAFAAGAAEDAVSREPLDILGKMSQAGSIKTYSGKAHTARLVGRAEPKLWTDLEVWLLGVFEAPPRPAQALDHAPDKAKSANIAKQRKATGVRDRGGGNR